MPPNLGDLSAPQETFADFFHLDPDLPAVAAQNSPRTATESVDRKQWSSWIESFPVGEKDAMLVRLMAGEGTNIGMELKARFQRRRSTTGSTITLKARTVSELLAAAETHRAKRRQEEQRKAALEKEQRARQAAIDREKLLDSLKGRAEKIWADVETLVATRQSRSYDLAVQHLIDLRDLAIRESRSADFTKRFERFRGGHSPKRTFIDRLAKAAL
ncbi:MAG: hypothetical protein L0Y58_24310 [Verrucomicrobia subdivision 3 bacterium]|nr:hypothetical protein [Limisphaerales bacterium]